MWIRLSWVFNRIWSHFRIRSILILSLFSEKEHLPIHPQPGIQWKLREIVGNLSPPILQSPRYSPKKFWKDCRGSSVNCGENTFIIKKRWKTVNEFRKSFSVSQRKVCKVIQESDIIANIPKTTKDLSQQQLTSFDELLVAAKSVADSSRAEKYVSLWSN